MENGTTQDVQFAEFVERLKTITGKQFLRFLSEKKVKTTCAMCGHNGRQVIDETNYTTAKARLANKPPRTFVTFFYHTPGVPVDSTNNYYYRLTCGNCGFITEHSVKTVVNWIDEKIHFEKQLALAMLGAESDDEITVEYKSAAELEDEE